ncbi:MAG: tetratricopeptide repeat protein [Gemmatimonadetes bacterium]|nr:tetratricopeptide repeat protein [Gemmatimonadota bacterium]
MSESVDGEIRFLRSQYWSERDPEGRAFVPLADAYRRKGYLEEAASLVEDGIGRLPDFASGHLVAALVARDRGDSEGARSHLERVLHLDPENVTALLERSRVAAEAGGREAAVVDLRELLRLEPSHWEARQFLADVELAGPAGRGPAVEQAVEQVESVKEQPGERPEEEPELEEELGTPQLGTFGALGAEERLLATRTMGELYARQGFVDRAIEVYEHLLTSDPHDEELSGRLGELRGLTQPAPQPRPREELRAPVRVELEAVREVTGDVAPLSAPLSGRSISAYLGDLLAWVPGAVPVESLAPDAVPTESLAPDAVEPDAVEMDTEIRASELASAADRAGPIEATGARLHEIKAPGEEDLDDLQSWLASLKP